MARRTARQSDTFTDFETKFSGRLQWLARSHDLLVHTDWRGATLEELVRFQLAPFVGESALLDTAGPELMLRPEAVQNLGFALHELATNAAKYGALSVPGGHVAIRWQQCDGSDGRGIEISWAESEGPDVKLPERRGFGTLVVEKNLARALDADVSLDFDPAGVRCRIVIPPAHVLASR